MDGWNLFRKKKVFNNLVKRYSYAIDQNYTRHKITVCAYAHHIYDLFNHQRRPFLKTRQISAMHSTQHSTAGSSIPKINYDQSKRFLLDCDDEPIRISRYELDFTQQSNQVPHSAHYYKY